MVIFFKQYINNIKKLHITENITLILLFSIFILILYITYKKPKKEYQYLSILPLNDKLPINDKFIKNL